MEYTKYLAQIEKDMGIKILYACETGSRAWGFPSPDSDYDIRIIYMHSTDWYLGLSEKKDSIDLMFENNIIDITGWDLRKCLRLLWKSNPALLERIQSPIIYQVDMDFLNEFRDIAKDCYSRIATIHHYLNMGKKHYAEIVDTHEYRLKKFFYTLRASVACLWILEKEEMPPIVFQKMLDGLSIESKLRERISELVELKSTISEAYLHTGEKDLFQFMNACLIRAENEAKTLPSSKVQLEDLNSFFIKTITSS